MAQWDDYNFFTPGREKGSFSHVQLPYLPIMGRPLNALYINLQDLYINNLHDLSRMRLLSILYMAIIATLLYRFYRLMDLTKEKSIILSFCVSTLPGFSYFINVVTAQVDLLAIISSLVSFLFLHAFWRTKRFSALTLGASFIGIFIPFLLILISLFTYPVAAMVFPFCITCVLIFRKNNSRLEFKSFEILSFLFFLLTCFVYFTINSLFLVPFFKSTYPETAQHIQVLGNGMYAFSAERDLTSIYSNLIERVAPVSFNLWDLHEIGIASTIKGIISLYFLVAVGKIIFLVRKKHFYDFVSLARRFLALIVVGTSTALPNVVAPQGYVANRTVLFLMASLVVVCLYPILNIRRDFNPLLVTLSNAIPRVIVAFAIVCCILSSSKIALGNFTEMKIFIERTNVALEENTKVLFVQAPMSDSIKNYVGNSIINDEFNMVSPAYPEMFVAAISTYDLPEKFHEGLLVKIGIPSEEESNSLTAAMIDMSLHEER
jgi:hypothetical protein